MATALSLSQITTVKNLIERDLLTIASNVTSAELDYLGVNVLTGIEQKKTNFQYIANESVARKYVPGHIKTSTLGNAIERVLEVTPVITRVLDNIRNYAEKEPVETIGISEDGVLNTPIAQKNMEVLARQFAAQNLRNFFFGDTSLETAYNCYNGIFKNIGTDITAGNISTAKGNLQLADALDLTLNTDEAKVAAYEAFDKAFDNLDEDLQDAGVLNVALSKKMASRITQGAALKFKSSIQGTIMQTNDGVRFFDRQNVVLKPTRLIGNGQTMLFYVPNAMELGSDLTRVGDPESAFIKVAENQDDFNELIYQMQVALGTRLWLFDSTHFCVVGKKKNTNEVEWNTAKTLSEGVNND